MKGEWVTVNVTDGVDEKVISRNGHNDCFKLYTTWLEDDKQFFYDCPFSPWDYISFIC